MRVTLKELMDLLGVDHVLTPYETMVWSQADAERGVTCSAEVRMEGGGDEVEAEIQMLYDAPPPGQSPLEQVLLLRATPKIQEKWTLVRLRVRGEDQDTKLYDWETKGCNFFRACVSSLLRQQIPDIGELIARELSDSDGGTGGGGSGGSKAPKIRPNQVLGMKQGKGF